MRRSLKEILITRDGLTPEEADSRIEEAKLDLAEQIENGSFADAFDFCEIEFGLEPDYLDELY